MVEGRDDRVGGTRRQAPPKPGMVKLLMKPIWVNRIRLKHAFIVVLLLSLSICLGNWQRQRADYKSKLRDQYAAMAGVSAKPLSAALQQSILAESEKYRYQLVEVSGKFLADQFFWVDNRIYQGRAGYHLIVPLKIAESSIQGENQIILINRGWMAQGSDRNTIIQPLIPTGTVVLRGRLNIPVKGYLELGEKTVEGRLWQNLDPTRFANLTHLSVLPMVVEELPSNQLHLDQQPAEAYDLIRDWAPPDWGITKHRSYMLQWYLLGFLAGIWYIAVLWHTAPGDNKPNDKNSSI